MVAKVGKRSGWFDRMAGNVPDLLIGRLGTRGIRILIPRGTLSTPLLNIACPSKDFKKIL
jgi:hypothetical protein